MMTLKASLTLDWANRGPKKMYGLNPFLAREYVWRDRVDNETCRFVSLAEVPIGDIWMIWKIAQRELGKVKY